MDTCLFFPIFSVLCFCIQGIGRRLAKQFDVQQQWRPNQRDVVCFLCITVSILVYDKSNRGFRISPYFYVFLVSNMLGMFHCAIIAHKLTNTGQ